jgi:hypothetical protein
MVPSPLVFRRRARGDRAGAGRVGERDRVDLEFSVTEPTGQTGDRAPGERQLAHAGSAVAVVVSELETMVFEHPEHGWRRLSDGDIAYDRRHKRLYRRSHDRWSQLDAPQLEDELDRRVSPQMHG